MKLNKQSAATVLGITQEELESLVASGILKEYSGFTGPRYDSEEISEYFKTREAEKSKSKFSEDFKGAVIRIAELEENYKAVSERLSILEERLEDMEAVRVIMLGKIQKNGPDPVFHKIPDAPADTVQADLEKIDTVTAAETEVSDTQKDSTSISKREEADSILGKINPEAYYDLFYDQKKDCLHTKDKYGMLEEMPENWIKLRSSVKGSDLKGIAEKWMSLNPDYPVGLKGAEKLLKSVPAGPAPKIDLSSDISAPVSGTVIEEDGTPLTVTGAPEKFLICLKEHGITLIKDLAGYAEGGFSNVCSNPLDSLNAGVLARGFALLNHLHQADKKFEAHFIKGYKPSNVVNLNHFHLGITVNAGGIVRLDMLDELLPDDLYHKALILGLKHMYSNP